eukprot:826993-Pyramimonas_sp.AAC.1
MVCAVAVQRGEGRHSRRALREAGRTRHLASFTGVLAVIGTGGPALGTTVVGVEEMAEAVVVTAVQLVTDPFDGHFASIQRKLARGIPLAADDL